MPMRAPTICSQPGCAALVYGGGRCEMHRLPRGPKPNYGSDWPRIRAEYLAAYPYCVECDGLAVEVDHRVAKRDGGGDDWGNLQGFCKSHHSRKTAMYDGGFGNKRR